MAVALEFELALAVVLELIKLLSSHNPPNSFLFCVEGEDDALFTQNERLGELC